MATFRNEQYREQEIVLDGNSYEECTFVRCTLIYNGGEIPSFSRCSFQQPSIQLDGAAYTTTEYLRSLYGMGFAVGADKILDGIVSGELEIVNEPVPPPAQHLGTNYGALARYAAVIVFVGAILGAALWYGYYYYPEKVVLDGDVTRPLFAQPVLDVVPVLPEQLAETYDELRASQVAEISTYEWVDRGAGTVKIPIDQAMEILVEQGMPMQEAGGN